MRLRSRVRRAEAVNPRAVAPTANVLTVQAEFAAVAIANAEAADVKLDRPSQRLQQRNPAASNLKRQPLPRAVIATDVLGLVAAAKSAVVQTVPVIQTPS